MSVKAIVRHLNEYGSCYVLTVPSPAKCLLIKKMLGRSFTCRDAFNSDLGGYVLEASKEVNENVGS